MLNLSSKYILLRQPNIKWDRISSNWCTVLHLPSHNVVILHYDLDSAHNYTGKITITFYGHIKYSAQTQNIIER